MAKDAPAAGMASLTWTDSTTGFGSFELRVEGVGSGPREAFVDPYEIRAGVQIPDGSGS